MNEQQRLAVEKQSLEQTFFALVQVISQERMALDSPWMLQPELSIAEASALLCKKGVSETSSLTEWELDNVITECGTTVRLIIAASGLLLLQDQSNENTITYWSVLHALMDSDLAHVTFCLGARWSKRDVRVKPVVVHLELKGFIGPEMAEDCAAFLNQGESSVS
ncbi:MAG: hypothetical protein AAF744_15600 [Pseudomonadota bacterium]